MSTQVEATIRELEARRIQTLIDADYDTFEAMCDPRAHYIHSKGTDDTLDVFVGNLRKGTRYSNVTNDIQTVVATDSAVVVSSHFTADLSTPAGDKKLNSQAGITYALVDGDWKVVWMQMTAIPAAG